MARVAQELAPDGAVLALVAGQDHVLVLGAEDRDERVAILRLERGNHRGDGGLGRVEPFGLGEDHHRERGGQSRQSGDRRQFHG
jgi:hypothetical protein